MTPVRWCLPILLLLLLLSPPAATASPSPSDPTSWACSNADLGLGDVQVELAPVNPSEQGVGGGSIQPVSAGGSWVPVILVHGWTGRSTHPNTDGTVETEGAFSHLIDLTADRLGSSEVQRSLVGQLQTLPGAAVFTFDYHAYSGRWVTDSHLGPALGKVIDCLARSSMQKVVVVGHSMGGLVARYAASTPDRSNIISEIITLGTPNTGSLVAALGAGAIDAGSQASKAIASIRLILSACGAMTSVSLERGGLCDLLPQAVASFDGEAGRALRAGSAELAALPSVPEGILVDAIASETTFSVPKAGWFSFPWETTESAAGDMIVMPDSATWGSTRQKSTACRYQLSAVRGSADELGMSLGLITEAGVADYPLGALSGPCFHASLMRNAELTNEVLLEVADRLPTYLTDAQILDANIPGQACGSHGEGWAQSQPIDLNDGQGIATNPDGSFAGAGVMQTTILGRVDVNADGVEEVALAVLCAGSTPEMCCAGRSSMLWLVGIFATNSDGDLELAAPVVGPGASMPGDQYGPAPRAIKDAWLEGPTVVTTEYVIYYERYTPEQVGGPTNALVTVRHDLVDGVWQLS